MRVLHLGKFHPPHPGGVERHSAELMDGLASLGVDVSALVHHRDYSGLLRRPTRPGVRIETARCLGQVAFVPLSPSWPGRLADILRRVRPQLLHVHVPNASAFWVLASSAARRIPWILHWHADIPHDSGQLALRLGYPLYRRFEHALLARAARVVTTSEPYLASSRALAAVADRCHVIPLGIGDEPASGTAPQWPGGTFKVLSVGRLTYYKGFDVLLEAVARVPEVSLLLIGAGEQRTRLERRIVELGLQERVRLAGQVDDATLEAAYRACDLFCLSSVDRAEAFGMVLLEAMRARRPVLATDIPGSGVGSVVKQGVTGRLVAPRNPDALAQGLRDLSLDPAARTRMGAAGRERWEQHYRIDAVSRSWAELYREVLAAHSTAA